MSEHASDTAKKDVVLEVRGIDKRFPGVHALKQVHFQLKYGEVLALVGENGAGKSTLMKVLTAFIRRMRAKSISKAVRFLSRVLRRHAKPVFP